MIYYQVIVDNGDGSNSTHRFKTRQDANAWLETQGNSEEFEEFGAYPYGDLETVDTESKFFWSWPDPFSYLKG